MSAGLEAFKAKTPDEILIELQYTLLQMGRGAQIKEIRDQNGETIVYANTSRADLMQLIDMYTRLAGRQQFGRCVTVNPFDSMPCGSLGEIW